MKDLPEHSSLRSRIGWFAVLYLGGVLAAFLIGAGLLIGLYLPSVFSLGGWLTALALLFFAFVGRRAALSENQET